MIKEYQLVSDIEFYQNENQKYMLSSEMLGVHLVMNENLFVYLKELTQRLRNEENLEDTDENMEKAIEFLKKYQLLYSSSEGLTQKTTVEAEILGNKIISRTVKMEHRVIPLVVLLFLIVGLNLSIFTVVCIGIARNPILNDMVEGYQNFSFFQFQNIVIMIALVLASLCFHECGHALFANLFHVYVKNISVYLHFGVAPMIFLKYRNIYHTSKYKRILIYSGGMIFNLFMVNLGICLLTSMDSWIGAALAIMNLVLILTNICSFVNTDTYFILCELFDFGSLKLQVLKAISQLMNRETSWRECKSQPHFVRKFVFFLVSYLFKAWLLIQFTWSAMKLFQQQSYIKYGMFCVLTVYYIVTMIKFIRRLKTKVY